MESTEPNSSAPAPSGESLSGSPPEARRLTDSGVQGLWAAAAGAFTPRRTTGSRQWDPPPVERLQEALPGYEVEGLLACGGMGAVYKGVQQALKRPVAIKVLPPEIDEGDLQFAERFKREAQAMAQLSHPNIVAVHDAGETADGLLYFVMEYVEGTDVAALLQGGKPLPVEQAVEITGAVCEALAFAHEEGIIHRDIKPSNVMIDARDRVKVADFGLAKAMQAEGTLLTRSDMALGTPDYIAPEAQIPGTVLDGRADLYAVGVMLYQMLTGRLPKGRFDPPSGVVPQVDKRLDAIVDKALQTDREKRYATAREMKRAVAEVGRTAPVANRRPLKAVLAAAASVAVMLGGGVWFLLKEPVVVNSRVDGIPSTAAGRAELPPSILAHAIPLWSDPGRLPAERGISWETDALRLQQASLRAGTESRDAILRATVLSRPGSHPFLALRARSNDMERCQLSIDFDKRRLVLRMRRDASAIKEWNLPPTTRPNEWVPVELRAIGDTISVWVHGQKAGETQSSEVSQNGQAMIFGASNGDYFRDIEYIPLDGLPEAEVLKAAGIQSVSSSPSLAAGEVSDPQRGPDGRMVFPVGLWTRMHGREKDAKEIPANPKNKVEGEWLLLGGVGYGWYEREIMPMMNLGIRADFRGQRVNAIDFPQLNLRGILDKQASVNLHIRSGKLQIRTTEPGYPVLAEAPLHEPLTQGKKYRADFYAIGRRLIARVNGQLLTAETDLPPAPGVPSLFGANMDYFKDVHVLNLDGLSEAEALRVAGVGVDRQAAGPSAYPIPAVWMDATAEVRASGLLLKSIREEDGRLMATTQNGFIAFGGKSEHQDGVVRAIYTGRIALEVRHTDRGDGYQALVSGSRAVMKKVAGGAQTLLGEWVDITPSLASDADHEAVFAVEGDHLRLWVDQRLVFEARDDGLKAGKFQLIMMADGKEPPARLRKLEYGVLDQTRKTAGLNASPPPSAATKEAPFINSLGMKFVPVPIIGGPTDGDRVLFSIWETRVQDYAAFIKARSLDWRSTPFAQEPTHPAVNVSWLNAVAFCAWLTETEQADGRLPRTLAYRLPSDHEWSCAAGIGSEEDASLTPSMKTGKLPTRFVWGTQWPPPPDAGNFGGEEAAEKKINPGQRILTGYRDPFPYRAPVGSFPPNSLGLFDLAGNVFEWCSDWHGPLKDRRTFRSSAFNCGQRGDFTAAHRMSDPPDNANPMRGFRVVLAENSPAAQKNAAETPQAVSPPPNNSRYPVGEWVSPFQQQADINETWFKGGATWQDGWITPGAGTNHGITLAAPNGLGKNWGVRARYRWAAKGTASLLLRRQGSAAANSVAAYEFRVNSANTSFRRSQARGPGVPSEFIPLREPAGVTLEAGDEVLVEAFIINGRLYGRVNGTVCQANTDGILAEGGFEAAAMQMTYRDIEFINLDGLDEAEALKVLGLNEVTQAEAPLQKQP